MKRTQLLFLFFFLLMYKFSFSQDLFSGGTNNKWIFHTPTDGRTSMFIAPFKNNDWAWGSATQFFNNGNVIFSGNVGVGTNNPLAKLEVRGNQNNTITALTAIGKIVGNDAGFFMGSLAGNPSYGSWIQTMRESDNFAFPMIINPLGGNVGIGTNSPLQKLEVEGNGLFNGSIISSISGVIGGELSLVNPSKTSNGIAKIWNIYNMTGDYGNSLQFWAYDNVGCTSGGLCANKFTIMDNGYVGIGTISPDSKLTVAGNIHAQEVKVTLNAGVVPDYVFAKDYKLKSLQEVENFINKNNHLPEIPSAKEIEKNGLMLAEMNMSLLKKIEELTLYMIEMKKENSMLKLENDKMKATQLNFEERIKNIEKK